MKLHHAAALALVGWYLMVPPSMSETNWLCGTSLPATASHELFGTGNEKECARWAEIADMNAPLSEWHEASPFETLSDCEEGQKRLIDAAKPGSPEHGAKCIATDDPRLMVR